MQLLCSEDFSQPAIGGVLLPLVEEQRDEIVLGGLLLLLGLIHRFHESNVFLVIGQRLDNVGNRDLKNNVHTALQVKTETNLRFQTLLVGIDTQILHRILIVLCGDGVVQLGGFAVVIACGSRERQVEDACKRQ